jgi:hypothetical protein
MFYPIVLPVAADTPSLAAVPANMPINISPRAFLVLNPAADFIPAKVVAPAPAPNNPNPAATPSAGIVCFPVNGPAPGVLSLYSASAK